MSSGREMLRIIGQHYNLIVRNEYHVQIEVGKGKYHDFWPMRDGGLKVKLFGMQQSMVYDNVGKLMDRLGTYDYRVDSDLSYLRDLERLVKKAGNRDGIYCDAGFKEGKAKIAVIRVFGNEIDLHVRHSENFNTSIEAEAAAIRFALAKYPLATEIFSDCQSAVDEMNKIYETRPAVWIDRSMNKNADRLSNLRKRN